MKNTPQTATAGNNGDRVRSDCFVSLELTNGGGLDIQLKSKVAAMFGDSIKDVSRSVLQFFGIDNARLAIDDRGALPFVIAARTEAAVKQLIETDKAYLFPVIEANQYTTGKEQFRFSRLYLPGNTPSMMINAGIHRPNGIILDLEDSVAPARKAEARILVRNVLCQLDFYGAERMVRINQGDMGLSELPGIVPYHPNMLLVPKCESAAYIEKLDAEVQRIKEEQQLDYPLYYMPIIESALGVEKAFEIATASPNVVALAIGLEDFTADLGVRRTQEGTESLYARMRLVNACKAARIQAIDSVFSDVSDMDALRQTIAVSKSLGFEGMGCIHPRQIKVIHESYAPEAAEIEKAQKIVAAFEEAEKQGLGVVSLGSKMIDPPVVKRALRTVKLAQSLGLINNNS